MSSPPYLPRRLSSEIIFPLSLSSYNTQHSGTTQWSQLFLGSVGPFWTSLPHTKSPILWSSKFTHNGYLSYHWHDNRHRILKRTCPLTQFVFCHLPGGFHNQYSYSYSFITKTNAKIPFYQRSHHYLWFLQNQCFVSTTLIQLTFMKHIYKPNAVFIAEI